MLGVVTVLLAGMTGSFATAVIGAVVSGLGVALSFALRRACPSYRSDAPEEPDPNRPQDHYV